MSSAIIARPTDKVINVNITYDDMSRPVAGPQDPFNNQKNRGMNSISGMLPFSVRNADTQAMLKSKSWTLIASWYSNVPSISMATP